MILPVFWAGKIKADPILHDICINFLEFIRLLIGLFQYVLAGSRETDLISGAVDKFFECARRDVAGIVPNKELNMFFGELFLQRHC